VCTLARARGAREKTHQPSNDILNLTPVILAKIVALDRPDASLAPIFGVGFQKRKIL
jgi:hypothetical protein